MIGLDKDAAIRVLEALKEPPRPGATPERVAAALTFILDCVLASNERLEMSAVNLEGTKRSLIVEALRNTFESKLATDPAMEALAVQVLGQEARLLEKLQARAAELKRDTGPGRPRELTSELLPGLLGLFHSSTGRKPTASHDRASGKDSEALDFVRRATVEMREHLDNATRRLHKFDQAELAGGIGRSRLMDLPVDDSLRKAVERAMEKSRPATSSSLNWDLDYRGRRAKVWRDWSKLLRRIFFT